MGTILSLVSATFMFVIIVWIGPIFRTLPRSVLSCIVIGMFQQPLDFRHFVGKIALILFLPSLYVTSNKTQANRSYRSLEKCPTFVKCVL